MEGYYDTREVESHHNVMTVAGMRNLIWHAPARDQGKSDR